MIENVNMAQINNSKYFLSPAKNLTENSFSAAQNSSLISHSDLSNKKKAIVLTSAILGMTPVLAIYGKKAGFSLNPKKIFKTPIKDWMLFKYKPLNKIIDFEDPIKILSMATSSVIGGLIGGSIVDKNNIKAKKREALNQLLGDVIVPIGCVWTGAKGYKALEPVIQKFIPKINKETKTAKILNSIFQNIPKTLATLVPLGIGIVAGNKVSNEINEKIYHKEVDRNIRLTDFAPHIDDLCMSISMVNNGSTVGSAIGRAIPFALLVPGYETGTAREDN